jgi:glycosyltransferase involved in cell wall biosynthesis
MSQMHSTQVPISEATVLLAGTARDVATHIGSEIDRLITATKQFKQVFVLIVESDSSDNTLSVLEDLKKSIPNFDYLALGKLSENIPSRTERLAHCRNQVIEAVRSNPLYATVDYVMLADLDGLNSELTASAIANCWNGTTPWDVVTANQLDFYYDVYALRHRDWSPSDCLSQQIRLEPVLGHDASINLSVWAKQVKLPPERGYIEVDSAFGGFAIYKKVAFLAGTYIGRMVDDGQEKDVCEHVAMHAAIRKAGYQIFINCALINCKRPADPNQKQSQSGFMIRGTRSLGIMLFGKKRFKKYLDLLAP